MSVPYDKYQSGEYLELNPDWDQSDSPWKAKKTLDVLKAHDLRPETIVEVGCGAGGVLAELGHHLPAARLIGYDIAPDASRFWGRYTTSRISFVAGDFATVNTQHFDMLLLLDVIEHVPDPHAFLLGLRPHAEYFVLHIPLDLSVMSVLRETPLLHVRRKVGHIHYFTKGIALQLLQECGFKVVEWRYTGAAISAPGRSWKTRLANIPRACVRAFSKDLGVRLFGGETLLVLAIRDLSA